MPQIELKQYADEIARLIEDRQTDAAIDHCRHILGFYPRYLPVYRLLAQASMEKGDYAHATHFLQSLLSADPENAGAWADLAGMSEDLGELEQATWLMERAFEIEPGNADIREHLRGLYKRRDGIDRPRLKLTPGALGRMYATGGFYRRAIHELQRVLESSSALSPLHTAYLEVGLARAFGDAQGMDDMAEKVCHSLLGKLPNCLQAHLMMGQILLSRGQADEAERHLAIARALDPEGRTAQALFGDRSPIPFERVEIPHLETGEEATVIEQPQPLAPAVEDTSWLDQVGEAFEGNQDFAPLSEQALEAQRPAWLGEWSAQEAQADEEAAGATLQPADREQVGPTAPLPEWMLEAEPEEAETDEQAAQLPAWLAEEPEPETAPPVEGGIPDATLREEDEQEIVELPAWLQELASEAEPAEQLDAVSGEEETARWTAPEADELGAESSEPEAPAGLSAEDLPDWLRAFDESDLEEPAPQEEARPQTADEEVPEWMQAPGLDAPEVADDEQMAEDDLPDWLRSLEEPAEAPAMRPTQEEPTVAGALDEEELPAWLRDLREQEPDQLEGEEESLDWLAEEEGEREAEIEPLDTDELPDWLRELRAQRSTVEEPLAEAETDDTEVYAEPPEMESLREDELPEWLQGLRAAEAAPEPERPEELPVEGELPDWLKEIEAEAAPDVQPEVVDEEELPEWLRELRAQEPISWDDSDAQTAIETPAEEVPDWLAEIQADEEVELTGESIDEEALPDWLRELHGQEASLPADEVMEAPQAVSAAADEGPSDEPLGESIAEGAEDLERQEQPSEEDLPEWLRALRAAEGEPEHAAPIAATPTPEALQPDEDTQATEAVETELPRADIEMPEPAEGMPAWLSELEAEIAGQAPVVPEVEAANEPTGAQEVLAGELPDQVTAAEEPLAQITELPAELPPEPDQEPESEAQVEDELQSAEAAVEEMFEPLVEEAVPGPEAVAEPAEEAEAQEPMPEEPVEELVFEAEAEEVVAGEEPDWVRELEAPTPQEQTEATAEAPAPEPTEVDVEPSAPQPVDEAAALPAVHEITAEEEQLALARSHLSERALDEAARQYEQLVDVPSVHLALLDDLEQAVDANPDHPALLRVLGDVYMRTGELRKALRSYQRALHNL